jgi:thioredoxin reductase (NADPH)
VIIVGGGNSAGQAAMFLSRTASHGHLMVRGTTLAASMSDYLSSRLEAEPTITLHFNTQITGLRGDRTLSDVEFEVDGAPQRMAAQGVFVMVGAAPNTNWLPADVSLDANGFVLTGDAVGASSQYATSVPGIFAVGDVRAGSVKRVASAVGEGSVCVSSVWAHVQDR